MKFVENFETGYFWLRNTETRSKNSRFKLFFNPYLTKVLFIIYPTFLFFQDKQMSLIRRVRYELSSTLHAKQ